MKVFYLLLIAVNIFHLTVASPTDVYKPVCSRYSDPPRNGWKKWSDRSSWRGGAVPGVGNRKGVKVNIPCDTGILLDVSVTVDQIIVDGWLKVEDRGPFQVNANFVVIQGRLTIGTESRPYRGKIIFNLTNGGYEYEWSRPEGKGKAGIKGFIVLGGQVELNGMYGNQKSWSSLTKTAAAGSKSVTVSGDLSAWPIGGKIAIASTDYNFEQAETAVIVSVQRARGVTVFGLAAPLKYMHWGDPISFGVRGLFMDESAEVALLDRSIVIQGQPERDPFIGGHFMVFQTPGVQKITGVELVNMGQQGLLGRYPMHFHLGQNMKGSYARKLSVHHSLQRCVVVHGSWNLVIDQNVAYETFGHCFFLEDGIEFRNTFSYNLGLSTRPASRTISSRESNAVQSDGSPSTFWISNPNNNFLYNVAAGSPDSGYWFQLAPNVLGPSTAFSIAGQFRPKFSPIGLFIGNVAHSHGRTGLRTYSDGYRPRKEGGKGGIGGPINAAAANVIFKNFRAYKNAMDGMFIHETDSVIIDGGYFADNRIISLELHQVEHVIVRNAVILGETANIGNPSQCDQTGNAYANCQPLSGCGLPAVPSRSRSQGAGQTRIDYPMFGVLIDQSEYPSHGLTVRGNSVGAPLPQHLINVTFGLFDNRCRVAAAISANGHTPNAIFLASHSSRKLTFTDRSPRFYMAPRQLGILGFESPADAGPTSASYVFRDIDGSLIGSSTSGYLVTNTKALLPAGKVCKNMNGGYAWACPGTCYRTVAFTLGGVTATPKFTVTRVKDGEKVVIEGYPTTFLNLLSGSVYEVAIDPQPSSIQLWYADPEGCSRSIVFRILTPSGFYWNTYGASWMSCSGSLQNAAHRFQVNSGCFRGSKVPSLQVILGGKSNSTLQLVLTPGLRTCSFLRCGLLGEKERWTYNDMGVKLKSPDWSSPQFSTRGWKAGNGLFGYGGKNEDTPINTASQMDGVTWYFRTQFGYTKQSCLEHLLIGVIVNDGVVVYINGKEIYRNNLPNGVITADTKALSSTSDFRIPPFTVASIPLSNSNLISGMNTVAVEVHSLSLYSWNVRFDLHLSALGSSCNGRRLYSSTGIPLDSSVYPTVVGTQ